MNGNVYAQASQIAYVMLKLLLATLNLDEVRSSRASVPSRNMQAAAAKRLPV